MTFGYDDEEIVSAVSIGEDERATVFCAGGERNWTVEVIPGAPPQTRVLGMHVDDFRRLMQNRVEAA